MGKRETMLPPNSMLRIWETEKEKNLKSPLNPPSQGLLVPPRVPLQSPPSQGLQVHQRGVLRLSLLAENFILNDVF